MVKIIEGDLIGNGSKFGIIVARFNDFITSRLMEGAVNTLTRHGVNDADIEIVRVPGAFEIFQVAKRMIQSNKYNAIICLGAVIRGDTPHFNYVSGEASKGVSAVAMEASIPVLYGILTTDNLEQAVERAGSKSGNKGAEAAMAAIEMVNVFKKI